MNKALPKLIKQVFRRSFDQSAPRYDATALLQHEVGQRLLERLQYMRIQPQTFVDVGSGTSETTLKLCRHFKKSRSIHLDIAHSMLLVGRAKTGWLQKHRLGHQFYICGDAESLPLASNSVDLVFSNLAIQWCGDLDKTFAEFKRILRPGGTLLFSTLGPDTLKELRDSWRQADVRTHVHPFIDMHDIGDALLRCGFADPVMDMECLTMTYHDALTLMRDLKTIGARNAAPDRNTALQGKRGFQTMLQHYEKYRCNGVLPASYEVIYGNAWVAPGDNARNNPAIKVDLI
ncbi:MAG: malonyl-ACP O-methyltransferase BioC [Gammaproteobacteria bacterium]|nr:malonyl-ACP O-methyltransferase BioC [Gammaproteobacteria bacterium]MDH5799595.1 malonyl-ACP O-methyltransferase BioC [Gammaproteobacteria bacterium]